MKRRFGNSTRAFTWVIAGVTFMSACGIEDFEPTPEPGDEVVESFGAPLVGTETTIGKNAFVVESCKPKDARTLYPWNGAQKIPNVMNSLQTLINYCNSANLPCKNKALEFYPPSLGLDSSFVVYSFPGEQVKVSGATVKSLMAKNILTHGGESYNLVSEYSDKPELVPNYWDYQKKEPYKTFGKPITVVAAREIVLTGDIDIGAHAIMLVAEKLTVKGAKIISKAYPPTWDPSSVSYPRAYIVAKQIVSTPGKKLTISAYTCCADNSAGAYPAMGGEAIVLAQTGLAAVVLDSAVPPNAVAPKLTKRSITAGTYVRLLKHYAPRYVPGVYALAENLYRMRAPSAQVVYNNLYQLTLWDFPVYSDPYTRFAKTRLDQIAKGLNYIGENDNLLRQDDVKARIDQAKMGLDYLNVLGIQASIQSLKDLYVQVEKGQTDLMVSSLTKVSDSLKEQKEIVKKELEAAQKQMEYAKVKLEAEQANIKAKTGQKESSLTSLTQEFGNFQKASEEASETDWWDIIVGAVSFVWDLVTVQIPDIVKQVKEMIETVKTMIESVKKMIAQIEKIFESLEKFKEMIDMAKTFAEDVKGLIDKGKTFFEKVKSLFEKTKDEYAKIAQAVKGAGDTTWNPTNPGSGEDDYPKTKYPSVSEMADLDNAIIQSGEAVKLATLDFQKSQALLEAAQLKVAHIEAEIKRNAAMTNEVKAFKTTIADQTVFPIEAGVLNMAEQICRFGQRTVEKTTRLAYKASRALAYMSLNVSNAGPVTNGTAKFWPAGNDALAPHNFKFTYNFFDGSYLAMQEYVLGLSTDVSLTDRYAKQSETFGQNRYYQKVTVDAATLAKFKLSGILDINIGATNADVMAYKPLRVAFTDVVLEGAPGGVNLVVERADANVYRFGGVTYPLTVPTANVELASAFPKTLKSASTYSAPNVEYTNWNVKDYLLDAIFGLSLEGSWRVKVDPNAGIAPATALKDVTKATVVFHTFGQ